jgi:anti-sigma regulatory factor (Ser/Thr protein kinase)
VRSPSQASSQATTFSRAYAATARQIKAVRADLRALLDGCPIADDVILCASELAANAAQHSQSARPGGTLTVSAQISPDSHVLIEVDDDGGPWTGPSSDLTRGRGLKIVGTLATRWGITPKPSGRTVWAQFDWPATASGADQPQATRCATMPARYHPAHAAEPLA